VVARLVLACLAVALGGCAQTFDLAVTHSPVQSQTRDVIERQTGDVSSTVASAPPLPSGGRPVDIGSLSPSTLDPKPGAVIAVGLIALVVVYGFGGAIRAGTH
jgi:hypothetical protein